MNGLNFILDQIYAYCTDFIINLANILELSYYEINFIIFILLYPFLLFATPTIYIILKIKLNKLKKKLGHTENY
jgi:hypothetical protein